MRILESSGPAINHMTAKDSIRGANSFRNIVIIASIAVLVLPLFIYFYLYPSFTRVLTQSTEQEAERIAKHLSSMFVIDNYEFTRDSIPSNFKDKIEELKTDFGLAKVKFFAPSGKVIYSTNPNDEGIVNTYAYFQNIVANGQTYTQVIRKNTQTLEGQMIPTDVVETYVPVMKNSRFVGAFEIYYDITAKKATLDTFLTSSYSVVFIITFSLLVFVVISSVQAKRNLELRNAAKEELREHLDNLDSLVKDRTVKLTEANRRLEEEIADRQQTQDELKKSEDRFRNLVETTNDWIWELDNKLAYTYVGPRILDILGYTPDEVLGKTPFDLMSTGEASRFRKEWSLLTSEQKPFNLIEKTCIHKNGDPVIIETSGVPIRDASGVLQGYRGIDRDITKRKWAEEFVKLSKRDWEETFDTIDDIITIHDMNYNVVRVNKAAEGAFGMNVREIVSTKCFRLFHGQSSPPDNCPSCQCLKTKKPFTYEYFEPNLNRHLEIKAIPRLDPDDQVLGIIHIVRDISERKQVDNELLRHKEQLADMVEEKTADLTSAISLLNDEITSRRQAEEALRMSEKKYRDLYNNAPDMYHTLNSDKIIIDCNETEAKMLGYRKEEIIGRPLADFFTDESKTLLERDYPILAEKKVLKNLERTFIRKDGTTFQAILNVFGDFDEHGDIKGSRAIARDITELKQSENELKNVNRTLKTLSDFNYALLHFNEETALLDETCSIIVNTGSYRMAWVGYAENNNRKTVRPVAQTGDTAGYLKAVDITWGGPDRAMEPAGRVILSRNSCISRNLRIDSDFIPWCAEAIRRGYKSTLSIPPFENEDVIGSLNIYAEHAYAFDSEEIDLLEKLAQNLSYGITVLRSNVELKRAEAEAMRAGHLASLGELAAGVAHEINNPINGIINYAEILLKKSSQGIRERDIIGRIIKEGDRIANIVRSLLSFARDTIEERKPVRVHTILSDTLALTETQLSKDGIKLKTHIPYDLSLFAQPQQIEQVFLNLISNARYALNQQFPGEHPDKILKIHGASIQVEERNFVRITFHDRGTGIPDDIKAKIMNPFFSTKPSSIGTGLGLSISHGIVSNHNGKIVIDSAPGKYTKVIIDLPAYAKQT